MANLEKQSTDDVKNLVNTGVNYLSTGAGFLGSTVFFKHTSNFQFRCYLNVKKIVLFGTLSPFSTPWKIQLY